MLKLVVKLLMYQGSYGNPCLKKIGNLNFFP